MVIGFSVRGWLTVALVGASVAATCLSAAPATAVTACGVPAPVTVNGDGNQLDTYSVDATLISTSATADLLGDIAYLQNGTLYGTPLYGLPRLEQIDPTTGATLNVVPLSGPIAGSPNGLSSLPDGFLVAGVPGVSSLYVIDPVTGASQVYPRALPTGYTSAGDFFVLADGDLLAVAEKSGTNYLVRLHADGTSTVVGSVPSSYGAAFSGGAIYLAGTDGVLRRVEALPTEPAMDPLTTTDVLTSGYSMYGAASPQDAAACPNPVVAPGAAQSTSGAPLPVTVSGFPADTDVTVTITDRTGNTVGAITLHTDIAGNAQGAMPTDATAAAGDAIVTASIAAGLITSAPVTLIAPPGVPAITGPKAGAVMSNTTPAIAGSGTPGNEITVMDDAGTTVCTTTVTADATWSCTPDTALPDGNATLTATATNSLGAAAAGTPVTFTVDTAAPVMPAITDGPAADTTIGDATPTLGGVGEDGTRIELRDPAGRIVCTTTVTGGTWSCTPSVDMPDGKITITPVAVDAAGNETSGTAVSFRVDTTAPSDPKITDPAAGFPTSDNTPTISGIAEPGSTVTVTDDAGTTVCSATAAANGSWSCAGMEPLSDGSVTVHVIASDLAANSSGTVSTTFTVDTIAPAEPTVTTDPNLPGGSGPLEGTAEPNSTVAVADGDHTLCRTQTRPGGTWTCNLTPSLPAGATELAATATDAAGNRSTARAVTVTVHMATAAAGPTVPTIPIRNRPASVTGLAYTGFAADELIALLAASIALVIGGLLLRRARHRANR